MEAAYRYRIVSPALEWHAAQELWLRLDASKIQDGRYFMVRSVDDPRWADLPRPQVFTPTRANLPGAAPSRCCGQPRHTPRRRASPVAPVAGCTASTVDRSARAGTGTPSGCSPTARSARSATPPTPAAAGHRVVRVGGSPCRGAVGGDLMARATSKTRPTPQRRRGVQPGRQ